MDPLSPSFPVMLRENALKSCRGEGLDHPSHIGLNFFGFGSMKYKENTACEMA